jgi:hypothetical protein
MIDNVIFSPHRYISMHVTFVAFYGSFYQYLRPTVRKHADLGAAVLGYIFNGDLNVLTHVSRHPPGLTRFTTAAAYSPDGHSERSIRYY